MSNMGKFFLKQKKEINSSVKGLNLFGNSLKSQAISVGSKLSLGKDLKLNLNTGMKINL